MTLLKLFVTSLLTCFLMGLAQAQPTVGSRFEKVLPLGSGASVPLPEGQWQATAVTQTVTPNQVNKFNVTVLKNLDLRSPYAALVIRASYTPARWPNTICDRPKEIENSFLVNRHGTINSQLLNKCSRFTSVDDGLELWIGRQKNQNSWYWPSDVMSGLGSIQTIKTRNFIQAEFTINQFEGFSLRYNVFMLPPAGISSVKFSSDYKAGRISSEHQLLEGWANILMESLQQSFFNKKPQPILALNYKTDVSSATVASVNPPTLPPIENVESLEAEKLRDARTQEILRELANPRITSASAPKPPSAPSAAISPSLPPPSSPSAQERETRELKAQLDQMREMLSKLQAANAASAAAATNKPSETPLAAAPKPMAKPVFANRKALIIGNDLYTDVPKLQNAAADAEAMSKALEGVGFKVSKHLNLNEKAFKQALRDFRLNIQGGDEVLFFFAGHGVQLGSANYLLPTDIKGDHEEQVKDEAIQLQKVLDDLQEKKTKFALAVIDACRDNPFKGQSRAIGGRGLAPTSAATGQMIMFSAGSGQQALDKLGTNDKNKNGLFTRIFLKEMIKPGVSVDRVLRNVRNEVVTLAKGVGHEQTPALYDQAVGEFFFVP
ncbi:caspase family protein [Limnohabitans sp. 2KL-51]|uniref:caspase family protein n=1 Tax=Limnohabitans sp. 2KL-51 TaxID=1977911 RepID=UPI000D348B32|nr:caspase family protein [Limnohabitans sp. 2KL-51]PUE45409.1 hypothetical protein B9Z49_16635 [Limnohabitans sp. 2KL-51]